MIKIKDKDRLISFFSDKRFFEKIESRNWYYDFYKVLNTPYFVAIYLERNIFCFGSQHDNYGDGLLSHNLDEIFKSLNVELQRKFLFSLDDFTDCNSDVNVIYIWPEDADNFFGKE